MLSRALSAACVALVVLAAAPRASAQTVDELIEKNIAAKGGAEKLKSVETVKQTSELEMQGTQGSIVIYGKRPNLLRQEMKIGGQTVINAFDGVTPWIINPLAGSRAPIAVMGPQAEMIKEQSDFDGSPLVNYRARGFRVELVGEETVNERKAYHLRLVDRASRVQHVFLDGVTYLESRLVSDSEHGSLTQELSDYRDVSGVKVPFRIRTLFNGVQQSVITVKTVEFNVKIDDAIFKMPLR